MADQSISQAERIRILLAEYTSLRSEIINRSSHMYQLMGFTLTALALLIALSPLGIPSWSIVHWLAVFLVFTLLPFGLWVFYREIGKAAARVREIELDINDRAQEDLLVWENLWGGAVTGGIGFGKSLPRKRLETSNRPIRTWRGKILAERVESQP